MTPRFAGDSIELAAIPASVGIVGTYGNGGWATTPAQVEERFPHHRYGWIRIDATGANADTCNTLDVEAGDATPKTGAEWVQSYHVLHPAGELPVVYCNRSNEQSVRDECAAAGLLAGHHYGLWVATLDGTEVPHSPGDGIVACQWKGERLTGGHWDQSLVYDPHIWLPVTLAPAPRPVVPAAVLDALTTLADYLHAA